MAVPTPGTNSEKDYGVEKVKEVIMRSKMDFIMFVLRMFILVFTIGCLFPFFWNSYTLYFKALMSYMVISGIRLHQRLPQEISSLLWNRYAILQILREVLKEDSFHYLLYSSIFVNNAPVTIVLLPIFLFSLLHLASYSLTLLDALGPNSWCWVRFFISLIEFQSRTILKIVSITEIFLMPFTVILIFLGRASLLIPFIYYHFLYLRYSSRRNPYTRNMFHDLRLILESTAKKPGTPSVIRHSLLYIVSIACRLGPNDVPAQ